MVSSTRNACFIVVIIAATVAAWCAAPVSLAMSGGSNADTGILSGTVTRAPIVPVERPGVPSSAPVAGIRVVVTSPEGKDVAFAFTDKDGKYSISLPPGTYFVSVSPGPLGRPGEPAEVTITKGAATSADIRIDTRIR
jgi:hypothetical protein